MLLANTIWALLVAGGGASKVSITNFKMTESPTLDTVNMVTVETLHQKNTSEYHPRILELLENPDNVIQIKDSGSIILHKSKLNTAYRVGGIQLQSEHQVAQEKYTWMEVAKCDAQYVKGPKRALTGCLNNTVGGAGVLGGTFTKTVGVAASQSLGVGIALSALFNMGVATERGVATSVIMSGSYSCTVPSGYIGQVFVQPILVKVTSARYRTLEVRMARSWWSPVTPQASVASASAWVTSEIPVLMPAPARDPLFVCIVDQTGGCDNNVIGDAIAI